MGYSDIGCYGAEIETPHLDGLAARGLRFSQFYAGTHHAGPTRADPPPSGPGPMDSFHTYDTPWANVSGTPLFGYKDTCYEGGIATPLVVSWPAGLKARPGHITHAVGHIMDIVPTCLELAGAARPATFGGRPVPPPEGRSLAPIFRGGARPGHEYLFIWWPPVAADGRSGAR